MSREKFIFTEGAESLGVRHYNVEPSNYRITTRSATGDRINGADMHINNSRHHRETHLDGLHIYYNPYAAIPLDTEVMHSSEITHNLYDVEASTSDHKHPDGALVSRQVYEPENGIFEHLVRQHMFYGC
jgi:hypothetical protein